MLAAFETYAIIYKKKSLLEAWELMSRCNSNFKCALTSFEMHSFIPMHLQNVFLKSSQFYSYVRSKTPSYTHLWTSFSKPHSEVSLLALVWQRMGKREEAQHLPTVSPSASSSLVFISSTLCPFPLCCRRHSRPTSCARGTSCCLKPQ